MGLAVARRTGCRARCSCSCPRHCLRCTWRRGRLGGAIPILGRIGNSPHVPVVVERHSDKKVFPVIAQRQASRHASGNASAARQIIQQHWSFERQRLRRAESAALRADHESDTLCGEGMLAVEAGHGHGNLHAQSRAAPRRPGCKDFHLLLIHRFGQSSLTSLTERAGYSLKKERMVVTEVTGLAGSGGNAASGSKGAVCPVKNPC